MAKTSIPCFTNGEDAAIHTSIESNFPNELGVSNETNDAFDGDFMLKDLMVLATENRSKPINSPYVYAVTSAILKRKYVADGYFSSTTVNKQVGVIHSWDPLMEHKVKQT